MPHHTAPHYTFTEQEFERMKTRIRVLLKLKKEVMGRLIVAREMGDLSENGAYKYAKFELGNIRRELKRLNHFVEHGSILHPKDHYETVELGCTVTIEDENSTQSTYTIVNEHESNPMQGKLSEKSPLGKLLLYNKIGNTIELQALSKKKKFKIISL